MRKPLVVLLAILPLALLGWVLGRGLGPTGEDQLQLSQRGETPGEGTVDKPAEPAEPELDPEDQRLLALLATPLAATTAQAEPKLYDKQGLFDYIDGAAPVFIDRGFRMLAAVDLTTEAGSELTCDVYDMRSSKNATAIYQKERPKGASWATYGDESHRGSMALVFRKDRYYVKLTAFDADAEAALPGLAKLLVQRVAEPTAAADAPATDDGGSSPAPQGDANPDQTLRSLFATPLAGAKIDGEVTLYDQQGLFDYIDGAAPIFIERGFRKLAAADLVAAEGGEMTCDVYDMATADNAQAIYQKERPQSAETSEIGDEGHSGTMALVFRRDRFYVKMTAFDADAETLMPKLAQVLLERMP